MQGRFIRLAGAWAVPGLIAVLLASVAGGGAVTANASRDREVGQAGPRGSSQSQTAPRSGRSGPATQTPGVRPEWEWWKDVEYRQLSGLTEDKAKSIDGIYQFRQRQMRPFAEAIVRESAVLDRMTRERVATEDEYRLQAQHLETLVARLRESRRVMLYRMYQQLTPEQYQKLIDLGETRSRRRQGRGAPPR